jgi:flagellar hook-associated protein 1 FlgK
MTLPLVCFIQGQAPSGFFASFLTQLGNTVSSATADQTTSSAALTQVTTQRNALSGVSLDEEAANLTQYQRSYQAAAKVYSIVDQILQSALNLGVPTAVS